MTAELKSALDSLFRGDPADRFARATEGSNAARTREIPDRPIPLTLMKDDTPPNEYHILITSCRCSNCNTVHETSDVLATRWIRSGTATWKHSFPISSFKYNVPITYAKRELKPIPACHECFTTLSLSSLPSPEYPKEILNSSNPEESKSKSPRPSLDSLLDSI